MEKVIIDISDFNYKIDFIPPYLQSFSCRGCDSEQVKKVISIGSQVRVPFCGEESCKKIAIEKAINMHRAIIIESMKKRNKKRWFENIKFFPEAIRFIAIME